MTHLILSAILLAAPIPIEERYGGVIATLGPSTLEQVTPMIDKVCGKGKWKLWKITSQSPEQLPPELRGMQSKDYRFYCLPVRRFKP